MTSIAVAGTLIFLLLFSYKIPRAPPVVVEEAPEPRESAIKDLTPPPPPPTVNLVLATIGQDNVDWTSGLSSIIPNLTVVSYVADDENARYHPPENKGREAIMYHSYFFEFYDNLPDISILGHAEDRSWHSESMLLGSLQYSLMRLDLQDVIRRGYVNLRVTWENACPDWIDTTNDVQSEGKLEEVFMREAFIANFAPPDVASDSVDVPQYLNQPCCSQFAVTKEAIRSVPKEEYERYIKWLLETELPDTLSGRTWEHMWQYLFTKRPVDCPIEWKVYCRTFHICFESDKEYQSYVDIQKELKELGESITYVPGETLDLTIGPDVRRKMNVLTEDMNRMKDAAYIRGNDERFRAKWMKDLYNEEQSGSNSSTVLSAQPSS